MSEMNAVVGYVPDNVAKTIGSKGTTPESLEIKLERGNESSVYVRLRPNDVAGVLLGASNKGETGVQVILNPKATVETFTRASVADFLSPIKDRIIGFPWRPPLVAIYVRPADLNKLIDLNRQAIKK
jgi:hypothetical protein